jgi:3-deoxy-7-phosphoheptulonate synthase
MTFCLTENKIIETGGLIMIITMTMKATNEDVGRLINFIEEKGYGYNSHKGERHHIIGIIGDTKGISMEQFEAFPEVEKVMRVSHPFKMAGREFVPDSTVIRVGNVEIGGNKLTVIAGPCAVEERELLINISKTVKEEGADILRGGAFKPRTSPYSFQGLGEEGLKFLKEAGEKAGMPFISEVMTPRDVELIYKYADIFQIGARNAQNFSLLKEVGKTDKPVMLKRGMMSTIEEWLMSAEYILSEGNSRVILCERGIRTFEKYTRNTLDLSAIPLIKRLSHLPIIVDPSHGTGHWRLVEPMAMAAVAAGADGIMVEVHPDPERALSDGQQSLNFDKFSRMMENLRPIARAVNKNI